MDVYPILTQLAALATATEKGTYTVTDYALGFIPFKNGENKVTEVGNSFLSIARWLLDELERNPKEESQ